MFDSIHKNPIPKYPKSVGVITLTGLRRDFLDVMNEGHLILVIIPLVQGEGLLKVFKCNSEINRLT